MLNFNQSYVKRAREEKGSRRRSPVMLLAIFLIMISAVVTLVTGCNSKATETVTPTAKTDVRLVFTQQPGGSAAGSAFSTHPVVAVEDAEGNIAADYRGLVVLTITAGTGASEALLYGGTKVGLVNGMVEFKGLSIDKAGDGYTLTATSGSLAATSAAFSILPGAPAKLVFIRQPSGGTAGIPLATQPEVTVQDRYGNTVTGYEGSVTLGFIYNTAPGGATLSGMTTVRVVNSVARFSDVSINKAYPEYKLTAVSGSLESATSQLFEIVHTAPVKLEFTVQPDGAIAGAPFETQPKVAVLDIYGNVATSSRVSITLSITAGTGAEGAALSGTKTLVTDTGLGGLAEFEDLAIDKAGSGYTLTATTDGLISATSQAFSVASP